MYYDFKELLSVSNALSNIKLKVTRKTFKGTQDIFWNNYGNLSTIVGEESSLAMKILAIIFALKHVERIP